MKKYKSFLTLLLLLGVLLSLSGCIVLTFEKYYDDIDREKLSSVEFFDLRNGQTLLDPSAHILPAEEADPFLDDLAKIRFEDKMVIVLAAVDPSFEWGEWVVRLNYTDGTYTLISNKGYGASYDANDKNIDTNHYGCADEEWYTLIEKYVQADS